MNALLDAILYFIWWIITHFVPQESNFAPQVLGLLSGLR